MLSPVHKDDQKDIGKWHEHAEGGVSAVTNGEEQTEALTKRLGHVRESGVVQKKAAQKRWCAGAGTALWLTVMGITP